MAKILVIEDEQPILEEILEWLNFEGYDAVGAGNGREGVQRAIEQHPDLIMCDITMPEMDGYQVLLTLREQTDMKTTPFIFLTARADRTFMRHGMELGADDYVTKPFTRAELLAALRTRLERRSALSSAYAQELEDTKLKLSRLVAHELKTPIASMQFVRDIIERQIDYLSPAEIKELLHAMTAGTDRLHHLVEQMVYWTRLETGVLAGVESPQKAATIQMWQLLPAAINQARRFAYRNQNGSIVTDMRDGESAVVGQVEPLRHALAELIANALNFSSETSPVMLSQWRTNNGIVISIQDSGSGMSPSEQAQAQEPFEQVQRERQEQQGMGLGLNVARRIIELYGGRLQLKSAPDKGTQVDVTLPLAPPEAG